jgi:CheY-like chemotaxis protein
MTASPTNPFTVLIVDDNRVDQELAAIYIQTAWPFEHGLKLDFAADGEEAVAKLQTTHYALVVLDWKLPTSGEGAVLLHLRQEGAQVPVVVVSGRDQEEISVNLHQLQAAYLNKNQMSAATLHQAIASALRLLGYPVLPDRSQFPRPRPSSLAPVASTPAQAPIVAHRPG